MEQEPRGVLLPFRRVPRPLRHAHAVVSRTGNRPPDVQGAAAAHASLDHEVNDEWDLLIRLATQAWSWRDPESLDVLENTVTSLRNWIGREWSL
jgi:hypothetical protein